MGLSSAGFEQLCDSCKEIIKIGEPYKSVRAPKRKAKTRSQAIAITRSMPKRIARHITCPPPEYQITCPTCLALPGDPCIAIKAIGVSVNRPLRQAHRERRTLAATQ